MAGTESMQAPQSSAPSRTMAQRYEDRWLDRFEAVLAPDLVRASRSSTLAPAGGRRSPGRTARRTARVGIDISREELEAAPEDAYDEILIADVTRRIPELEQR